MYIYMYICVYNCIHMCKYTGKCMMCMCIYIYISYMVLRHTYIHEIKCSFMINYSTTSITKRHMTYNWLIFPVGDGHYLQSKLPPGTKVTHAYNFLLKWKWAIIMVKFRPLWCKIVPCPLFAWSSELADGRVEFRTLGGCFTSPNPTRHLEDHPSLWLVSRVTLNFCLSPNYGYTTCGRTHPSLSSRKKWGAPSCSLWSSWHSHWSLGFTAII